MPCPMMYAWCSDGLPNSYNNLPPYLTEGFYGEIKTKDLPDNQAGSGNTLQDGICGWVFTFASCYNNGFWNTGKLWYGVIPTGPTGAPKIGVYTMTKLGFDQEANELGDIIVTVN